ncbi:MAG: amidophosphoribosyltransferase [Kiritimatiellaeota bacterium]|nr:amidophosphoribosyltransferase [Kiritimatiellota bacterium]
MGGFFGVVSKQKCVDDLFYGTDYHSHLGTARGGMAVLSGEKEFQRVIHDITNTQFRAKFEADYNRFRKDERSCAGVGVISDTNDQPLIITSHLGTYAIVTVGLLTNKVQLVQELFSSSRVSHFSEMSRSGINTTEVVASLLNAQETFEQGVRYAQLKISGSCSVLILTREGVLYAIRDRYGRTPVILGKKDGSVAVAMETSSFPNLGYQTVRDLGPGEMVKCTPEGMVTLIKPGKELAICSFLWVYFGYPASAYEGRNVEVARYGCGAALARRNPIAADSVGGVPDSGVGHALGYAAVAGLQYTRPFVKYTPTWSRSFTPQKQVDRDVTAQKKLIPVPELISGKRLVFCDDSIVRGTQLKGQVKRLFECGAKEIHMRIACPPLLYQCRFLNFSRARNEMDLITRQNIRKMDGEKADVAPYLDVSGEAYQRMVNMIRDGFGLSTLAFQRVEDLAAAIGVPYDKLCTYCFTGMDVAKPQGCTHGCAHCASPCSARRLDTPGEG